MLWKRELNLFRQERRKKRKKKGANKTINQDELQPVEEEMENLNSNDFQRDPSKRSLDKRENTSEQRFEVAPTQKTEEHIEPIVPELEVRSQENLNMQQQSPEKTEEETKEQTILEETPKEEIEPEKEVTPIKEETEGERKAREEAEKKAEEIVQLQQQINDLQEFGDPWGDYKNVELRLGVAVTSYFCACS